ncbi:MAG: glutamine-hydrolyzing carbamoyl-phosphate synthase small subunit [Oceanipulchritudo sp.]
MVEPINSGILALEDGSVYRGVAFGASKTVVGEAVFNTSMTGYQEIITDPSYFGQIVTMTAPQIGNYGISPDDEESDRPQVRGFVVRDLSPVVSNWRSRQSLTEYLRDGDIPGLSGIDTRALTKRIRVHGALKACLSTEDISDAEAVRRAREWPGLVGVDYVREVTRRQVLQWTEEPVPFSIPGTELHAPALERQRYPVVALDMGAKRNIFRKLAFHGLDVTVVPADTTAAAIREMKPAGIFISNGPGDPGAVTYAHETIRELLPDYPVFGICMGHQIIAHAMGASTMKLKFGHRGANQPVKNFETGAVSITAQNHGFASSRESLEACGAIVTELNLNDQTVAGLRHRDFPVFSVQYHPEASPGPHDSDPLFDHFYDLVARHAGKAGG